MANGPNPLLAPVRAEDGENIQDNTANVSIYSPAIIVFFQSLFPWSTVEENKKIS